MPSCRSGSLTHWVRAACSMPLTAACGAAPIPLPPLPAGWQSAMSDTARSASQVAYRSGSAGRGPRPGRYWILGLVVLAGLGWYFVGDREQPQQLVEQTRGLINKATEDLATKTANARRRRALRRSRRHRLILCARPFRASPIPRRHEPLCPNCSKRQRNWTGSTALPGNFRRAARKDLASLVGASMPALNRLCDRALSNPQIAGLAKPTIDALRAKLQSLAQA